MRLAIVGKGGSGNSVLGRVQDIYLNYKKGACFNLTICACNQLNSTISKN